MGIKVKVFSASQDRFGRRHIHARIQGYGVVHGVKTPGVREWSFDRNYAWTAQALVQINVVIDVAWRAQMKAQQDAGTSRRQRA